MDEAGYNFFVALLYGLTALLIIGLAACVWVAISVKSGRLDAHHGKRQYINVLLMSLRLLLPVFFCIFYVAILGFFLSPTDCMKVAGATQDEYRLVLFPDRSCTSTGHLVMGVVGLLSALVLFVIVLVLAAGRVVANPLHPDITSTMTYQALWQLVLMNTILVIGNHVPRLIGHKLASCIMLVSMIRAWHVVLRFLPYYQLHMNRLLAVTYAVVTWLCVCDIIMTFSRSTAEIMTIIGLALCPVAALVGYISCERAVRRHLRYIPSKFVGFEVKVPQVEEDHYMFKHEHEAAVASRCAIFHMKKHHRQLVPDEMRCDAAELILLTAMEQHPQSAYLRMVYSNFLMYVRKNTAASEAELEKVRALKPSTFLAYQTFVRAKERARSTDDVPGSTSMDFASYIEFMNSFKVVLADHKSVLKSVRNFWKALLRDEVVFAQLRHLLEQQKERQVRADRSYKILLERYPKNVKLLQSYSRFLDEVKNDTAAASRYLREAEKIEDEAKQAMDLSNDVAGGQTGRVDDSRDGVCVINMQGIVQHVNKVITRMFGFTKDELVGKNVRIMMPQPYQNNHDSYLQAYHTTGVAKVIGIPREMEGRHKNGYLIPIRLFVTKIDSKGVTQYMGIIRDMEDDPRPKLHLDTTGNVTSINRSFANQLGYTGDDLVNQPATKVLMPAALQRGNNRAWDSELLAYLETRAQADMENDDDPALPGKEATAFHKNGTDMAVEMQVTKIAGEGGTNFFTVSLRMLDDKLGIISIDQGGRIVSANKLVLEMFGYKENQLLKMNVSRLMPAPYSRFHDSYLARYAKQGPSGRVLGIPGGRTVLGLHAEGHTFPISLEVKEFKDEATGRRMFSGRITMIEENMGSNSLCLTLYLDLNAREILKVDGDAKGLFGFANDQLEGESPNMLLPDLPGRGHLARVLEMAEQSNGYAGTRSMAKTSKGKYIPTGITVERADLEGEVCLVAKVWDLNRLEGTVSFARDGTLLQVNHVAELFFSMSSDAMVNNDIKMLMTPKHALHHEEYLLRTAAGGPPGAPAGGTAPSGGMRKDRKLVGVRRQLDCVHKDGLVSETEFEVAELSAREARGHNGAAFVGRVVLRPPGRMRPMDDRDMAKEVDEEIDEGEDHAVMDGEDAKNSDEAGSYKKSDDGDAVERHSPAVDTGGPSRKPSTTAAPMALAAAVPPPIVTSALGKTGAPAAGDRSRGIRFNTEKSRPDADDDDEAGRGKAKGPSYGIQRFLQDPGSGAGEIGSPTPTTPMGGSDEHHALLRPGAGDSSGGGPQLDRQMSGSVGGLDGDDLSEASDSQSHAQQRTKRYQAALKALNSHKVRRVAQSMRLSTRLLLGTALFSYALVFALVIGLDKRLDASTKTLNDMASSLISFQKAMVMVRDLEAAGTPYGRPSTVVPETVTDVRAALNNIDMMWQKILLGHGGKIPSFLGNDVPEILDPQLTIVEQILGRTLVTKYSIWDAVRMALMAMRVIAYRRQVYYDITIRNITRSPELILHKGMRGDELEATAEFRYLLDNVVQTLLPDLERLMASELALGLSIIDDFMSATNLIFLIELVAVCLSLIAASSWLVSRLRQERLRVYAVFLEVPRPVTRAIASASISLEVESGDEDEGSENDEAQLLQQQLQASAAKDFEDDDDDDDAPAVEAVTKPSAALAPGPGNAAAKRRMGLSQDANAAGATAVKVTKSKKSRRTRMLPRGATPILLLVPSVLFLIIVGVTFLLNRRNVNAIVSPMHESYTARMLQVNCMRMLFFTQELATGGGAVTLANGTVVPPRHTAEDIAVRRDQVDRTTETVNVLYQGLVYGNKSIKLDGALFGDMVLARLLFEPACHREDEECPEDYDAEIKHGLDALLQAYGLNSWKFAREPATMNVKAPRFHFLWDTAHKDLENMLKEMVAVFHDREVAPRALGRKIHILAMLLVALGTLLSFTHVFSPYNKMCGEEVQHMALLLTSLPKNQVLSTLITAVLEHEQTAANRANKRKKTAANAATAAKQQAGAGAKTTQGPGAVKKLMAMF
eukprot:jgi/Mesvir1/13200/Mv06160-RA.2